MAVPTPQYNQKAHNWPERERERELTSDGSDDLVGYVADLEERVWVVLVVLQEVKDAEPEHVKGETDVPGEVKPVQHLHTDTVGRGAADHAARSSL